MNKSELIEAVAEKSEESKASTARVLDALLDVLTAQMASGEKVSLVGFGTFESGSRSARTGRNPSTGAELKIAAAKVPKFRPGASLKKAVNN